MSTVGILLHMVNWIIQSLRYVITNAYIATLAADSSNIIDVIQDAYNVRKK